MPWEQRTSSSAAGLYSNFYFTCFDNKFLLVIDGVMRGGGQEIPSVTKKAIHQGLLCT
jgi:hypothetical protein